MKSFFESKGLLKVVIAKGILSTYEINSLKNDSYVHFNDRDCGDLYSLYFNNTLIGYGTIVLLDKINEVGIRLVKTTWNPKNLDDVILLNDNEILNTELILGEREIEFSQITNLTSGSVISISCYDTIESEKPTTGKLFVSGIEVAKGLISINEDKWCIKITEMLFSKKEGVQRRDSFLNYSTNYKYFNFLIPDRVTREQLNSIDKIHHFFGKYTKANVINVDQLTWLELKQDYKNSNFLSFKKGIVIAKERENNKTYFLPIKKSEKSKEIETYFRKRSNKELYNQVMEKVGVVYSSNKIEELFVDNFNNTRNLLEASWRDKVYLNFGSDISKSSNIIESDFIHDYDMIIIVRMKIKSEDFILVYPLDFLVQVLDELK